MIIDLLKVFIPATVSFFIGISITPFLSHYFYKYKMWKRDSRSDGDLSETFKKIHNKEDELRTPRIGGILIWISAFITMLLYFLLAIIFPYDLTEKFSFMSRSQTWIPLFTLIFASTIGLVDDLLQIYGNGKKLISGLSLSKRILLVAMIGLIGAWWFYFKLDMTSIFIPFFGELEIGFLFIPFFVITMVGIFSGGIIDGIDGLAGGIMAFIFAAYVVISFFQNQIDLAAFCAMITGGILAFLWFNIPPARFYMGETGMLGLTATICVIAFLTNAVVVLPIISIWLVVASSSSIIQKVSKKYFNKKVFLAAPIHHHFQALGWPSYKITMRFWIISMIFAIIGIVVHFAGKI